MKNLKIFVYVNLALACLFSLTCFSFNLDISLIALPLSAAFTVLIFLFVYKKFLKANSIKHLNAVRRFFQYEPFVYISAFVLQRSGKNGMSYALDLVAAVLWVSVTITSFVILYKLSEKRVYALSSAWEKEHKANPPVVYHGIKRVGIEILEWLDALIQAIFTITLLNIFLFQLYEIPSESMVPTFLIKDRVVVFKTLAGPKFPLSEVGLPYAQKYDRGDIVVFRNPHYKDDRKSEVKSFLSQFVYMCTLTLVNINKDDNGELKADPLVKRVTGLPGEQLMMMDGTLYSRTKDSAEFKAVEKDSSWAAWNLNTLPASTRAKIQTIPLSSAQAENTLEIEEERRSLDLQAAAIECASLAKEFSRYAKNGSSNIKDLTAFMSDSDREVYSLFSNLEKNTAALLNASNGSEWVEHFLTDWYKNLGGISNLSSYAEDGSLTGQNLYGGDLYTDSLFRLNVMVKLSYGRILVQNAKLLYGGADAVTVSKDSVRAENYEKAQKLVDYLWHMDLRNMPIFPANAGDGSASYIPENSYFMMGDNRYNSLDMRHSYDHWLTSLDENDAYSVEYYSDLAPQYVSRNKILGKANFRFWPLTRIGKPGVGVRK